MCQLDNNKLICRICGVKCKHLISLQSHMKKRHNYNDEDLKNYYLEHLVEDAFDIKCPMNKKGCKGERRFKSFKHGFKPACANNACSSAKGFLDKHGVENCSQLDWVKEKKGDTTFKNYGVRHPQQSAEIRQGMEDKLEKEQGIRNVFQDKEIIEKIKDKNLAWSPEARAKRSKTNEKKYNNICSMQGKEVQEKMRSDYKENHGVDHWMKTSESMNKLKETNFKNTGFEFSMQNSDTVEKRQKTRLENFKNDLDIFLNSKNLELLSEYKNSLELMEVKCIICGTKFQTIYNSLYNESKKCPKCFPKITSIAECEIADFIKILGFGIIKNDRDLIYPKELDILIKDKKVAIEYCGLYWHGSLIQKDKKYHLNKLERCLEKGYKLITIFEDEWLLKQDIVKARLKHILGISTNSIKIRASKCEIKGLEYSIKNEFLNKYHIQGKDRSRIKLGAYYKDELVAVMTFGLPSPAKGAKHSQEGTWELNRFCSHPDYHIYGIASKMLKHFQENFEWNEIFSYADRRWSNGNLYKQLGFELTGVTNLNYWYWGKEIIGKTHRFNFRKSVLQKMKSYDPNKTEFQIMFEEGYSWIYDCGNLKYVLKR